MLDVLITISVFGAALDVIPWLFYDVSETGQKSMFRVIRLRTLVEDFRSGKGEKENYIEGCEAVMKARKYKDAEKLPVPKDELKKAKAMPKGTEEEKAERTAKIREIRNRINETNDINEEIEIASFVNFELERFSTDFGSKQLELVKLIVDAGEKYFYNVYDEAMKLAVALPQSANKEEKRWRKQEIKNTKTLRKSARLAKKYYKDGAVSFDRQIIDDAYDMPDETPEQQKIRRKAMKKANKEMNRYTKVATPYLSALRTVRLAEGYNNIDMLLEDYDRINQELVTAREIAESEARQLAEQRKLDAERRKQQRKMKQ